VGTYHAEALHLLYCEWSGPGEHNMTRFQFDKSNDQIKSFGAARAGFNTFNWPFILRLFERGEQFRLPSDAIRGPNGENSMS
jgi:hypothetical protein